MSKFAPHVPESLIDAVSLILDEAKVEPDAPDAAAVARRKALQAIKDRQEDEKAEKGEDKPKNASTKVAGHQYGGAKQKHEPEIEEELKGNQHKIDANKNGKIDSHDFKLLRGKKKANEDIELDERELSPAEADKKEKYVKSMKKGLAGFKARYGSKAKNVMYATATKLAKNEETVIEAIVNHEDIAKHLIKKHGKDVSMDHIEDAIDGMDDQHKVDKREVLYHIKKLTKEEVQIDEGRMKDIYTSMMQHADKKGYKSHKEFTSKDYDEVGKEHGISGKDLAVISGHKTAAKAAEESFKPEIAKGFPARGVKTQLPFTPDKNSKKIATAGKFGYGPSAAKHLAKQGMKSVKEETVEEGTGGPIYPKPFIKLGDLIARAKDMRNIKQATIVTPKSENEVVLKKEETEQVDETMMGKAGCTSEDDKKKAEKPVDYDKPTFLRKVNDWRKSNPKFQPKKLPMSKAAGALAAEEFVSEAHFMEIPSDVKKEIKKHIDNDDHDAARSAAVKAGYWSHFNHLVSAAAHSSHMDHDTHHTDIKQLHPYMSDYLSDKKTNESVEQLDELDPKTLASYANKAVGDTSKDRSKMIKVADKKLYGNADLRYKKEEVELDETAVLDKYIRSMGYDPQHLDKNKKVMFAKSNAYKTFASSQKTEGLYDGGQKGTQDIDTHMSPGATARG